MTGKEWEEFKAMFKKINEESNLIFQKLFGMDAHLSSMALLIGFQTTRNPESMYQNVGRNFTNIISELVDQKIKDESDRYNVYVRRRMQLAFESADQSQTLISYLSTLWYSRLPCFDVEGITSEEDGEKTMIKICKWKGKVVPCSKIFKKVATDSGICCAFNMKEADELFVKSKYRTLVKGIQEEERKLAFKPKVPFDWYEKNSEPKSQAGIKMGLSVVLDAHTDFIEDFSMNSDFQGFTAMVLSPGDFPLTNLNDFEIMPGHNNLVALTAMKVKSDSTIRSIIPEARKCYFEDETEAVKIHKRYTQINCLFECSLNYAQDLLASKKNVTTCTPWAFPFLDENHRLCDPWEKNEILVAMENKVPRDFCLYCLPDCNRVIYQQIITTQKFRNCDENNFGVSELCNIKAAKIKPQIWGKQVLEQLHSSPLFAKIKTRIQSSKRITKPKLLEDFLLNNVNREYDAYDKDIAVLNVFFSSPTAIEYATRPSRSWFDFLSAVGGNGGLFIGFSIVTALELVWVMFKIGKIHFQP